VKNGLITFWRADHLRVSLFSGANWEFEPSAVFAGVFGIQPESTSQKAPLGESSAVGSWDSLRVEVKRTLNRVDFIVQPVPDPQQVAQLTTLSNVGELFPKFTSIVGQWIAAQTQEITRLAIGCGALLPTDDVAQSYLKLKQLIRVVEIDAERFRDMQFQVNLPVKATTVPELLLNRISSWASIGVHVKLMTPIAEHLAATSYFTTCSIDVNTDAAQTVALEASLLPLLLGELCQKAIEILENGIE
jgi:hypothetical protein